MGSDTMTEIVKVGMPKWGLTMTEGRLINWLVAEGEEVGAGTELVEVETEKIAGAVEAPSDGVLRRHVAAGGDVVPVGGLLGVIAPAHVSDTDVDSFVAEVQAAFEPPDDTDEVEPPTRTVTVDGWELQYVGIGDGDGTPAVFVHGFGGDLNSWLFNTDALAQGRAAYAVDLPGHGASSKHVTGFDDLVAAFGGFLDAVGVDRAHLIGHSMGGAVALRVAADRPAVAASLTLIDSAGLGPQINDDYVTGFVDASRRKDLKTVLQLLFADTSLVTRQMVDDVLRYKRKDGVDGALRALAVDMFPEGAQSVDLRAELTALDAPVLVLWGAQDQVIPADHAAGLPEHVRLHVLDGQGHSPHMEAANEVNRLLGQFMSAT